MLHKPFVLLACLALAALANGAIAQPVEINARASHALALDPSKTAVIVCDMWNEHWCKGATARVAEMAPAMNETLEAARKSGIFIIHAPSSTMGFYEGTEQRKRAKESPDANPPPSVRGDWQSLDADAEPPLPIDDSDGGCDCEPQCKQGSPWKRQIEALRIAPEDAISDSGPEIYNMLAERGIVNVVVMGVHANMCVLGRPFSIRAMTRAKKRVFLVRDLTDTMYNHRARPYVSHFRGTDLVVDHIERYWCPSILSSDLTGKPAFRFSADK